MKLFVSLCLVASTLSLPDVHVSLIEQACGYGEGSASMVCASKAVEALMTGKTVIGVFRASAIYFETLVDGSTDCINYRKGAFLSVDFCIGPLSLFNCSSLKLNCIHLGEISTLPPHLPTTTSPGTLTGLILTGLAVLALFGILAVLLLRKRRQEQLLPDESLESELDQVGTINPPQPPMGPEEMPPHVPNIIIHQPAQEAEEDENLLGFADLPQAPPNILPQPPLNALPLANTGPRYNLRSRRAL